MFNNGRKQFAMTPFYACNYIELLYQCHYILLSQKIVIFFEQTLFIQIDCVFEKIAIHTK